MGRLNPDGSAGACTACHQRHAFSVAQVRRPENCGDVLPGFWSSNNVSNSVKSTTLKKEGFAVRQSRYTPEQIAFALRQAELGTPVKEVIRKMGISEQTFYRWKKKYGGLDSSDLRRLKVLDEENRRLKQMVADLSLDKSMLQEVLSKKL